MASDAHLSLCARERDGMRSGIARGIESLCFVHGSEGKKQEDEDVEKKARSIESRAYAAVEAASRTTTGSREREDLLDLYVKLSAEMTISCAKESRRSLPTSDRTKDEGKETMGILDISSDDRYFVDEDKATELLQGMLSEKNTYHTIKLSTKGFGREAARIVATALSNHWETLRHVDLSDIISGRPEEEALETLAIIAESLQDVPILVLDLSDQALGEKGLRACAPLLANPHIQELTLKNIGCSLHASKALCEMLTDPQSLRKLHLHNNMTGDEGAAQLAAIIARAPLLEDLQITSSRISEEGGMALAEVLKDKRNLRFLNLQDNFLGEAVVALADALASHENLQVLNLSETAMGDEGACAIAQLLRAGASRLEELHLEADEITKDGIRPLALSLAESQSLRVLNLADNELGDMGAIALCSQLFGRRCSSLNHLDLRAQNPEITKYGAVAVARCAQSKDSFAYIGLDGNCIQFEFIDVLKDILENGLGSSRCLGSLDNNDESGAIEVELEELEPEEMEEFTELTEAFLSALLA